MVCFQLFRFEVIGEPGSVKCPVPTIVVPRFQLFRFEVIGERLTGLATGKQSLDKVSNYSDLK